MSLTEVGRAEMREIQLQDRAGNAVRTSGLQVFPEATAVWQGLPVDLRSLHGSGEVGPTWAPFPTIAVCLKGLSGHTDVHTGSKRIRLPFLSGVSVVQEQGFEIDRAAWQGIAVDEVMALQLPPDLMNTLIPDERNYIRINTCMPIEDATLLTFAVAIRDELDRGCTSGRMFAQGLSMAFAGYVQARYGVETSAMDVRHTSGRLSQRELAQVTEFIDENMARDIGVDALSSILALSPSRFSRLFAATTGVSPYRFLQRQRMNRALSLLRGRYTLAEISQVVGFSSQSHFTQVFRKQIGTTPARLRAELVGQKSQSDQQNS